MYPTLGDLLGVELGLDTHGFFVGLGVLAAVLVFVSEARRRGHTDDRLLIVVTGALVGGAIFMRLGTWLQHLDLRENATLAEQWAYGNRSILGGLVGAWLGVHIAKRLCGYRLRTGDLFAPAVALGMAVGRIGCLLTELPGTPTGSWWGITLDGAEAARFGAQPGVALQPSFAYEIAFHLVAFAAIWFWLRKRSLPPGESFVWYVAGYGVFRFLVEFVRGNEVAWHGLTRPQLFLAVAIPFVLLRIALRARLGPTVLIEPRSWCTSDIHIGPQGSGMPLRGDRIHRYVNAFYPLCHEESPNRPLTEVQRLSGWLVEREDRIWLERGCSTHGLVRTLYDESPEILTYLEQWTAPTKVHTPDVTGNFAPVPSAYAEGLPEMQTQHTCILLQDLLDHCNLRCPTCFAASAPALASVVPLEQVLASIDARLSRENGRIDVLMLSGGEPTLYPKLAELLEEVAKRPIVRVLVNSNGLAIAQDDELLATLARHRERVEIYLQYDGVSAEASTHHRGADLRRFKERAIERLSGAGIFTTLTMTASLGVNDDEIGFVIKRALDTPYVGGVTIQPVFGSGRSSGLDPMNRLTHTGVLARLAEQTAGQVTWRDLTALPCSHPHCCSLGYLLRDDSGTWKSLVSLIGHERLKQWLDLEPDMLANRIADDAIPDQLRAVVRGSLLDLLSEQSSLSHPSMAAIWSDICTSCDLGIGTLATLAASKLPGQHHRLRKMLGERVLRVTVKPFMDMNTMIEERLTQCCVHVATVNPGSGAHQCAPFCAVQAWAPLSQSRISTAVGLPLVAAERR